MDVNICSFYPCGSFHKQSTSSCNNDRSVTPNVFYCCCKFRFQRFERCLLTRRGEQLKLKHAAQLKCLMAAHKRSSWVVSFHFLSRGQRAFDSEKTRSWSLYSPDNPAQIILDFAFLSPFAEARFQKAASHLQTLHTRAWRGNREERMRKFFPNW